MAKPSKNSIATGIYKQFQSHEKLKKALPPNCLMAIRDGKTKEVQHVAFGAPLTKSRRGQLERMCDAGFMVLEQVSVIPKSDPPLIVAGLKNNYGDRIVIAGMERDLADLFLGVYFFRRTYFTRDAVRDFWHSTNNIYIVGETFFI